MIFRKTRLAEIVRKAAKILRGLPRFIGTILSSDGDSAARPKSVFSNLPSSSLRCRRLCLSPMKAFTGEERFDYSNRSAKKVLEFGGFEKISSKIFFFD